MRFIFPQFYSRMKIILVEISPCKFWDCSHKRVKYLELLILLSFDWTRGNSVAITLWVLRLTFGKHDYKDWDKNFVKPQEGIELISKRPAIWDLCERDMSWMYNFRVGWGCARLSNWLPGCLQSLSLLEACVILRVL